MLSMYSLPDLNSREYQQGRKGLGEQARAATMAPMLQATWNVRDWDEDDDLTIRA